MATSLIERHGGSGFDAARAPYERPRRKNLEKDDQISRGTSQFLVNAQLPPAAPQNGGTDLTGFYSKVAGAKRHPSLTADASPIVLTVVATACRRVLAPAQ